MAKEQKKSNEITMECKEGICPLCGEKVTYTGKDDNYDNGGVFPWVCDGCGATGKEGYIEAFDGNHYDVEDANGNPITIVSPTKSEDDLFTGKALLDLLCQSLSLPWDANHHYTAKDGRIYCSSEARELLDNLGAYGVKVLLIFPPNSDVEVKTLEEE